MARRVYLAGPLFTQAEWQWNQELAARLRVLGFDIILPQERCVTMLRGSEEFSPRVLFEANIQGLKDADLVIAILDGADPDSGTSWECGYAYGAGLPIIGVRTDLRTAGDAGECVNLMLTRSCRTIIIVPPSELVGIEWLVTQIGKAIKDIFEQGGSGTTG